MACILKSGITFSPGISQDFKDLILLVLLLLIAAILQLKMQNIVRWMIIGKGMSFYSYFS